MLIMLNKIMPKDSQNLSNRCPNYLSVMRFPLVVLILCDIDRVLAMDRCVLEQVRKASYFGLCTLKNRRNSSGSPLLLMNLTTQTPWLL